MDVELAEGDAPADSARWARDSDSTVWCGSVDNLKAAAEGGHHDLELGACELDDLGMEQLISALPQLTSLCLTNCAMTDASLAIFGAALRGPRKQPLVGVGISGNQTVSVEAWSAFLSQLPNSVKKLDLGDNQLPDALVAPLAAAAERLPLQELFLDGNAFSDVQALVPHCMSCVELDLGDNRLTDATVRDIANRLQTSKLETLVLGSNAGITSAGVMELAYALPRSQVATLYLDNTGMDDAALLELAGILGDTKLEELHLDRTKVSDEGVLALCEAIPASSLASLDICDNDLSPATIAAIKQAVGDDEMDED
jgi:Leucine-rich repeat (LRR) protein